MSTERILNEVAMANRERMEAQHRKQVAEIDKLRAIGKLPAEERAKIQRRWLPYGSTTPADGHSRRETMTNRLLTGHLVDPARDRLVILAEDEVDSGGASSRYEISGFDALSHPGWDGAGQHQVVLLFQNGTIPDKGTNGVTSEALLAIVIDRLQAFQAGPFKGAYNGSALEHCHAALNALKERTMERMSRKVEGTEQP